MPANNRPTGLHKILFIPDCHVPYHDLDAFNLMLKAAKLFKPRDIVILGDFADCYSISDHIKHPDRERSLKLEISGVNRALDQVCALGAKRIFYLEGNHENRLNRHIAQSAPALHGLVTMEKELHLTERGIQFIPYRKIFKLGKIHITHDYGVAGKDAARSAMQTVMSCAIIGHTHRAEVTYRGRASNLPIVGAMFGWLGSFDSIDYRHQATARRDWVHGFGVGYMDPTTSITHVQFIPIIDDQCVVEGLLVKE